MNVFHGIIIGAPGSGKGTISSRIIKYFKIKHLSSGDILRNHVANKTKIGLTASKYMTAGKLVPNEVVDNLIEVELKNIPNTENWILDGYPRTLEQCKKLSTIVRINSCINLVVPFEIIQERLQSRWVHPSSGRVYNIGFNDPKLPGIDDITGEKLEQRDDDKPEAVKKRLGVYSDTMGSVIEYYKNLRVLQEFHGKATDEIWPKIQTYLSTTLKNPP